MDKNKLNRLIAKVEKPARYMGGELNMRIKAEAEFRFALCFPDTYQFYSLKDSGIRDLANAEGIVVARDQARHSDISVTNRYLKSPKVAHESTKHFVGDL